MADLYAVPGDTLTCIANAIRTKTGSDDFLTVASMAGAIEGISGGSLDVLTGTILIQPGEENTYKIIDCGGKTPICATVTARAADLETLETVNNEPVFNSAVFAEELVRAVATGVKIGINSYVYYNNSGVLTRATDSTFPTGGRIIAVTTTGNVRISMRAATKNGFTAGVHYDYKIYII